MPGKALVIGGTGPTGPFLVLGLMARGYEVTVLHRGTHEVELPAEVEHIHVDPHFLEPLAEGLSGRCFDLIVSTYGRLRHVAKVARGKTQWLIGVGGMPFKRFWDSTAGAHTLISAPEQSPRVLDPDKKLRYAGTMTEEYLMEQHDLGYYDATLVRYPLVYGPNHPQPFEWCIVRRLLDGRRRLIVPDGGLQLQTRAYAENAAAALLTCIDSPDLSKGKVYNTGEEQPLSTARWIYQIAECMGLAADIELVSMPYDVALPSRPYLPHNLHKVLDVQQIRAELGYRDKVHCFEGLRRTVQWYLDNRPEPGGAVERKLQDPFDYHIEDRLIQEFEAASAHLKAVGDIGFQWSHMYDHPKSAAKTE